MPTLKVDLVDGGDLDTNWTEGTPSTTGTRMATVHGLATVTNAAGALSYAETYMLGLYPVGTPYDAAHPWALLRRVRNEGMVENSDAARVRLYFDTPRLGQPPSISGVPKLVISDRMASRTVTTQINPATGQPMMFKWWAVDGPVVAHPLTVAELPFEQMMRIVVFAGIVRTANMDSFRSVVGRVDDGSGFMGENEPGFWRFTNFQTETIGALDDASNPQWFKVNAEVVMKTEPREDWSVWKFYQSPANGRFLPPPNLYFRQLRQAPYEFGARTINGAIRLGPYRTVSLQNVFGI